MNKNQEYFIFYSISQTTWNLHIQRHHDLMVNRMFNLTQFGFSYIIVKANVNLSTRFLNTKAYIIS